MNTNESPSSSNIWTVLVYPGEYDAHQDGLISAKSYIDIIGVDRASCIIGHAAAQTPLRLMDKAIFLLKICQ